jgi:DNA-binding CsgD family transcriptional regulator
LAGRADAALALVATASAGPLNHVEAAQAQRLKGQVFLDQRRVEEAVPFLLDAARQLELVEPALARETYLEALRAASVGSRFSREILRNVAEAARCAPRSSAPRAVDLLVEGLAVRFTDGYVASVPILQQALSAVRDEGRTKDRDVRWPWLARRVAPDLFDDETFHLTATRSLELARERGALGVLPMALHVLAIFRTLEGELAEAEALLDEADVISDAIGAPRIVVGRPVLAGYRGDERAVSTLIESDQPLAIGRGEGVVLTFGEHARAVLGNGLGRYEEALVAAEGASAGDEIWVSTWSLPELVEAAARSGRTDAAAAGLERLTERTQAAGTPLALGVEARSRALLSEAAGTEALYREALDHLSRCRFASELARTHLVYGEWLRRTGRRVDSREQLRIAHDMLATMGMHAFAERAGRELMATGATVRKREAETRSDLTAQESQIAQLASDGYSNPEIAAQLFLSPRTVEWHLRKVFAKLEVSSRRDIGAALGREARSVEPV